MYNEILPRMCMLDDTLDINLLTHNQALGQTPNHPQIRRKIVPGRTIYIPRFRRFVRTIERKINGVLQSRSSDRWYPSHGKGRIWQSTYYSVPPRWAGPAVVTIHDLAFFKFPEIFATPAHESFRRQIKISLAQADRVICVSEATKRDSINILGVPASNIDVVRHGYNQDVFNTDVIPAKPLLTEHLPQKFLLSLGNRAPNKNFNFLLKRRLS